MKIKIQVHIKKQKLKKKIEEKLQKKLCEEREKHEKEKKIIFQELGKHFFFLFSYIFLCMLLKNYQIYI
jgi:hypothetical protein